VQHLVRWFVLRGGVPAAPAELAVEAVSLDAARVATRERLAADGYRVRSLTFGPNGLVAYVEERTP
jgi:hypothetical protein